MSIEHILAQEGPPIAGGSAKRDNTHPTATVVYNVFYNLFRKRSLITVDLLALMS